LRSALWPAVIAGLALLVRLVHLGRDDFWSDEVHTFDAISLPPMDLMVERLAAGHQPLYFLALRSWSQFAGTSEFALRLPSALAGVLLLWPAYLLMRNLASPPVALWGTALFALHPLLVELSREARMYPFLLLTVCAGLAAVTRAFRTGRPSIGFWTAMVVGPLLHPTWGLVIVPVTVWIAWETSLADPRREPSLGAARRLLLLGCALSVAILIAASFIAGRADGELARRVWWEEGAVYLLRQVGGAGVVRARVVIYGAALVAWAGTVWLGWRAVDARSRRFAGTLFVGVHLLMALSALAIGVVWGPVRYVHVATLPVAFVAGAAIVAARRQDRSLGYALAWGLFGLAGLLLALRFVPARTEWSDAAAEVVEQALPAARADALERAPDAGARVVLHHYLEHPRGVPTVPADPSVSDPR
jgi:hypothetical protein